MGGQCRTPPSGDNARRAPQRDRELADLAEQQHGVLSRTQLLRGGFTSRMIERRLHAGRLHSLHRGVYALGHRKLSRRGHLLAAVLACGDDALLSHRSAAFLWGFIRTPITPVDVTTARGRRGGHGIVAHRSSVHLNERAAVDGIAVTSVARTLFDLAEVVDGRRLAHAWEEADRLNLLRLTEVKDVCKRGAGRRSLPAINRLLAEALAPALTRSQLEDRFATFCREHRLPAPATNVAIVGREVDVLWPRQRLIVELDGFAFHKHRAAFERDRRRDAALQAAGYRIIRLTHRRLEQEPTAVIAELHRLLGAT